MKLGIVATSSFFSSSWLDRASSSVTLTFVASSLFLPLASCGASGGRLLWALGVGSGRKTPAEFTLSEGPILILVDDPVRRIDWPAARQHLTDELAQQLIQHKATLKVIPRETIEVLKRKHADFEKRSAREIGALAEADQVIWIEAEDFSAPQDITEVSNAAYWAVSVKVLSATKTEDGAKVRLWPASAAGHVITVNLSGALVVRLKNRDTVSREMARQLAVEITKLFVEYKEGDFEK